MRISLNCTGTLPAFYGQLGTGEEFATIPAYRQRLCSKDSEKLRTEPTLPVELKYTATNQQDFVEFAKRTSEADLILIELLDEDDVSLGWYECSRLTLVAKEDDCRLTLRLKRYSETEELRLDQDSAGKATHHAGYHYLLEDGSLAPLVSELTWFKLRQQLEDEDLAYCAVLSAHFNAEGVTSYEDGWPVINPEAESVDWYDNLGEFLKAYADEAKEDDSIILKILCPESSGIGSAMEEHSITCKFDGEEWHIVAYDGSLVAAVSCPKTADLFAEQST